MLSHKATAKVIPPIGSRRQPCSIEIIPLTTCTLRYQVVLEDGTRLALGDGSDRSLVMGDTLRLNGFNLEVTYER